MKELILSLQEKSNLLNSLIESFKNTYHQQNQTEIIDFNEEQLNDFELLEKINEIENEINQKNEIKQQINKMIDIHTSIESLIDQILKSIANSMSFVYLENKNIEEDIQFLIKLKESIQQKITSKEVVLDDNIEEFIDAQEKKFKTINQNEIPFDFLNEEDNEIEKEIEGLVVSLCGMNINEKLFDSNIHKWNILKCEFGERVKGHRNVCIVIEDTNNNIFGGFCFKETKTEHFHFDPKGYVFSLKRNNEITMKKYPLKKGHYDFCIQSNKVPFLIGFGAEDDKIDSTNVIKDINIFKKHADMKNYCKQYSYDYNGEENALCGSEEFDVKRILVYKMEETDEMKLQREKEENKQRETDEQRWTIEKEDIEQMISEMTGKTVEKILFDSELHKWSKNYSEFGKRLEGSSNIVVLVEDELMNLFGGYIPNKVIIGENVIDPSCFVFILRKNGEYQMKTYKKNSIGYAYEINKDDDHFLMAFGICVLYHNDITLFKKDIESGYCVPECYEYDETDFGLAGKMWYNIKRIVVYQLK